MTPGYHTVDLARLALSPGEGRRLEGDVLPEPVELGGQSYGAKDPVAYRLEVSRTGSAHAFHLLLTAVLGGPCMRCLEPAEVRLEVDAREVHQPQLGDEELICPYVDGDELDLEAWAHDALLLDAPAQILCRVACAGLCPVCGESLNDADPEDHRHAGTEGPFAGLDDLLPT
jgi:uncharacterized protein